MTKENGGQAFPVTQTKLSGNLKSEQYECFGMTLLDYFAAAALTGLLSDPTIAKKVLTEKEQLIEHTRFSKQIARSAYSYAYEMLKQRDKEVTG